MAYSFYRAITIDHTKVQNSNQSDFPVLISGTYSFLKTVPNGGDVQNGSGYDIAFFSDNGLTTQLKHETEYHNAITGVVVYWVKVPTVSYTSDTVIYIAYGDAGISTDQSDKNNVWDSNYEAVFHLGNGTTLGATDSTSNANNGTISGPTAATGKIDGGANFVASNFADKITGTGIAIASTAFTVSMWIKSVTSSGGQPMSIGSNGNTREALHLRKIDDTTFRFGMYADDLDGTLSNIGGTWTYLAFRLDGSYRQSIWQDSGEVANRTAGGYFVGDTVWSIGQWMQFGGSEYWDGDIDEVRVSTTHRSDDWLGTEYNSQNDPATFYSMGSAVAVGAGANSGMFFMDF